MITLRFGLVAAIGLITAENFQSANACYPYNVVQDDCNNAIEKIQLVNEKLPENENEIRAISGTCAVVVWNKKWIKHVTRDQIREAATEHFKGCPGQAGIILLPSNQELALEFKIRAPALSQWEAWNADAEFKKAYCFQPEDELGIGSKEDCKIAYNTAVPVNPQTKFISRTSWFQVKYGSCMVRFTTSDGSPIRMKKEDADQAIIAMFDQCDKIPGAVNLNGATGPNGRLFVRTMATKKKRPSLLLI
ncbi:hypothetical protein PTTG_28461 [Puccinia triticina 1-1 BBBD Race 1]|uniref:Ecp2 effector protein domain-containing protein n=2 Tax=Puccinia triticina TaxID=208348 RepID=A0A180GBQ5_PUCT1|nr:uncharacterized protein PtA15_15A273 [Puccinia triticina]OAV90061.1 hypothetical protein PTTG_28461 [Puccinia triticina 1-1 BBBD Race 1]WAQ91881.1 hypothetical protein PtA15_15A273 [Puccinia triticina]WAR62679.1 hypothetical protein PtB15_15B266 [Puccinia triticina]